MSIASYVFSCSPRLWENSVCKETHMITGRCDPFCVPSLPSSVVEPEVGHQGEESVRSGTYLTTPAFQACDPNQNQMSVGFGFAGSAELEPLIPVPNPESLADPRSR